MTERLLTVSFGGGNNLAAITDVKQMSWPEFATMLTQPPPEAEDKASVGWYCAAEFQPVYRDSKNLLSRHAVCLDYDTITAEDVKSIRSALSSYAHAIYTTWSHSAERPRIRVVLPLSRPCSADEFCAVSRRVAAHAGIELASRESHVPAQMMFMPAKKPGASFSGRINKGEKIEDGSERWINVDTILAGYADWTDRTSWPHRADGDSTHHGATAQPPEEKPGLIGLWCRTFNCEEAITRFNLPYERVR